MSMSPIYALYKRALGLNRATAYHLPRLRELAEQVDVVVEFGVRSGVSTTAFLMSGAKVYSYDLTRWPKFERVYRRFEMVAGDKWTFIEASTLDVEIPECGLLFIDDLHEYNHVKRELELHSGKVSDFIAFHDTVSYGKYGQEPVNRGSMSGKAKKVYKGILPAIHEFLDAGGWRIEYQTDKSDGLMVLERVKDGAG